MSGLERDEGLRLLREMIRVRRFEERCVELYSAAAIRGFVHLYIGEGAVAVGVMEALPRTPWCRPTETTATPWPEAYRWLRWWPRCTAKSKAV